MNVVGQDVPDGDPRPMTGAWWKAPPPRLTLGQKATGIDGINHADVIVNRAFGTAYNATRWLLDDPARVKAATRSQDAGGLDAKTTKAVRLLLICTSAAGQGPSPADIRGEHERLTRLAAKNPHHKGLRHDTEPAWRRGEPQAKVKLAACLTAWHTHQKRADA